jgi:hypothetical protein
MGSGGRGFGIAASFAALCLLHRPAGSAEPAPTGNIDLTRASRWFAEFDSLCAQDGGALWGVSFCGPMLVVDPGTRQVVANRADPEHVLKAQGGVFVGDLPAGLPIANTAVEWQGIRWTMIMWWSLGAKQRSRLRLMGHECFHRMQPQLGLESSGALAEHLDTAGGRFWMQLEWNALQQAMLAEGAARRTAIADALAFRAARRARFPEAADREVPLEINEGVAEYSGMRLAGYSNADVVKAVTAKRADETGFVRSFAYVSGPLYGFLLDGASDDWRKHLTPKTDLAAALAVAMRIASTAIPNTAAAEGDAEERAAAYGGAALRAAEDGRETERQAQLATWRAALVDGPVLVVDLKLVKSGSFDPGKVFPFGDKQTVYTTRDLEAEWGLLTVREGAILEDSNTMQGRVAVSGSDTDRSKGIGWTLQVAAGWRIAPAERAGDFRLVKE